MEPAVDVAKARRVHMRVDLCRPDVGMPEQLLYRAYVRAVLEHVRGEAVPENVRRYPLRRDSGGESPFPYELEDRLPVDVLVNPNRTLANTFLRYIRYPSSAGMLSLIDRIGAEMLEFLLRPGNPAVGKRIMDLNLPRGILIAVIKRGGKYLVPGGAETLQEGDVISDIVGPLGKATEMEGLKKVCVVGGGVGCAIAYPIAKEMHERGIDVTFIAGFRSADIVILKEELKAASNKLIMCTDDGSYGEKGFTTVFLKNEIEANIAEGKPQFDRVIAIGPDIMMKFLADVTRPYNISTIISLDPIMVDGTGMCGCCRVIVDGETKFACVDGPDFDAHKVDFDSLIKRAAFYKDEQDEADKHICRMTGGKRNG